MRLTKTIKLSLVLAALALNFACGGQSTDPEGDILSADTNASFVFADLQPYTGLIGSRALAVDLQFDRPLSTVQVLCDETIVAGEAQGDATQVNIDSALCADGIVQFSLKIVDSSDNVYLSSEPTPVIVVNNGTVAFLAEGREGAVTIPANFDGTVDVDAPFHWDTPSDITRVIAVLEWELEDANNPWTLELTAGTGYCPHSGHTWGDHAVTGTSGPLVWDLEAAAVALTHFEEGQSFAHIKPVDAMEHLGESQAFKISVYLF